MSLVLLGVLLSNFAQISCSPPAIRSFLAANKPAILLVFSTAKSVSCSEGGLGLVREGAKFSRSEE